MPIYELLIAAALGGVVAVLILRPDPAQIARTVFPAPPEAGPRLARPSRASRQGGIEADAAGHDGGEGLGPYPRLAAEVAELRHAFKLLQNEWADKESRMDALIKRGHRLRKLEQIEEPPDPPPPVLSPSEARTEVLKRFRAQNGG